MTTPNAATRGRSAALFGNEKLVEVVLALDKEKLAHAQRLANLLGVPHNLVRAVLLRLADAEVVVALPRAGKRAAQQYTPNEDDPAWTQLLELCRLVGGSRVSSEQ